MNRPVVSMHPSKCKYGCPNQEVCYLKRRTIGNSTQISYPPILGWRAKTYDIYVSACTTTDIIMASRMMRRYKRVSMTVSIQLLDWFKHLLGGEFRQRIQVTVYNEEDIKKIGNNIQKLYLIKNQETLDFAKDIFHTERVSNIHFPIEQNFIRVEHLISLLRSWKTCSDPSITLDSCLENYVVHGKCLNMENYVDISSDGTYRKCPFKPIGYVMNPNDKIIKYIRRKEKVDCKYHALFGGDDGQ